MYTQQLKSCQTLHTHDEVYRPQKKAASCMYVDFSANIKAELAMSHMVACCNVWQIGLQNLGAPFLANLEIQ